jgi:hypothetical protein
LLQWNKIGVIKDPLWKGVYPNPFHMGFTHDSKKGYFVVLRPPPREWSQGWQPGVWRWWC